MSLRSCSHPAGVLMLIPLFALNILRMVSGSCMMYGGDILQFILIYAKIRIFLVIDLIRHLQVIVLCG